MVMVAHSVVPGTQIGFRGSQAPQVRPSLGSVVAIPLVHDWGPLGTELAKPDVLADFDKWTGLYGDSDTEGRTAVAGAFSGQGLQGAGGAGGVIPLRMGAGAVRAGVTIQNTAGSPVNALRLEGRWTGIRGNDYSYVIDVDPADAAQDRLRIRYKGIVVETYTYPNTDITALAAAITVRNAGNVRVASSVPVVSGSRLAASAGTSLAGGTNGSAPTGADHLAAQDALEFQPFTIIAPANLTDGPILASYLAWVQAMEVASRPVMLVVGGLAGEALSTAINRTTALADPHVVNFGVGTYHFDLLAKDLSTAQLAPLLAGVLAAKGQDRALTGTEIGGLHVVGTTGVNSEDAATAVQRGVTVLIRTDSDEADLRIAKGLTTFTSEADPVRPRYIFSEPRLVRIMDLFVRRMKQWGDKTIVGKPNNQDTRDAVRAEGTRLIGDLLRDGLILTKAQGAGLDPYVTVPVTTDNTIPFSFGWQFTQTADFLIGEGTVR